MIRWGLVFLIAATLILEILSRGPLRTSFWGFHVKAFLPAASILLWAPALAALALLIKTPALAAVRLPRVLRRTAVWLPLLLVAAVLSFRLFRVHHLFLGDSLPIAINLPRGDLYHPRAPLAHLFITVWYGIFGPEGVAGADPDAVREAAGWHSILWGAAWVLVAVGLGRALTTPARGARDLLPALAAAVLLAQGSMLLFFGYLEYYAVTAFLVGAYLLAGFLFLDRRAPLLLPAGLLVLLVGCHFSTAVLGPSLLALAAVGVTDAARRRGTVRDLVITAGLVVLLDRALAQIHDGFDLWKGLRGTLGTAQTDRGGGAGLDYLLSLRHGRDVLNDLHLIGPLGAAFFLLVLAAWLAARRRLSARAGFALAAALPVLAVCAVTTEPILGFPRDWDIFAPVALAFPVAAIALLVEVVGDAPRIRALLAAAALFSLSHTAGWVALNTSEPRSMERFAALPLGLGRGAVVIGNWHLRHGNRAEAKAWFQKALVEGPLNPNAHELLGVVQVQEGHPEEAAVCFARAVELRPDKPEYRRELLDMLLQLGRCPEALPHFEKMLATRVAEYRDYLYYGDCLQQLGRAPEAAAVFQRGEAFCRPRVDAHRDDPESWIGLGYMLRRQGRWTEALTAFLAAVRLAPDSPDALLQAGEVLATLGRNDEARPLLEHFVERYPQDGRTPEVRRWLSAPR